jgi:hypothetical protein
MSVRVAPKADYVVRSTPTQDGNWLVMTRKSGAASSPKEIPEGTAVIVRDGIAERLNP